MGQKNEMKQPPGFKEGASRGLSWGVTQGRIHITTTPTRLSVCHQIAEGHRRYSSKYKVQSSKVQKVQCRNAEMQKCRNACSVSASGIVSACVAGVAACFMLRLLGDWWPILQIAADPKRVLLCELNNRRLNLSLHSRPHDSNAAR